MNRIMFVLMYSFFLISSMAFGMQLDKGKGKDITSRSGQLVFCENTGDVQISFKLPKTKELIEVELGDKNLNVLREAVRKVKSESGVEFVVGHNAVEYTVSVQLIEKNDFKLISWMKRDEKNQNRDKLTESEVRIVSSAEEQLATAIQYPVLQKDLSFATDTHLYKISNLDVLINMINRCLSNNAPAERIEHLDINVNINGELVKFAVPLKHQELEYFSPDILNSLKNKNENKTSDEKRFASPRMIKGVCLGALAACLVVYFACKNNMISAEFMSLFAKMVPSRFKA